MNHIKILVLIVFISMPLSAQLTIEQCYSKARANYPLIRQYELIERARDYSLSNAGKAWLPQVQLSAKASYQSDVTKIPIDFASSGIPALQNIDIPTLSRDQYGASIDISQTVWDGGAVSAKRNSIRAESEAKERETDVSLYAVNERVNQLFFGVLLCDVLTQQNNLFQDDLQRMHDRVNSLMQNGLANQSDLDAVRAEQLKARQSQTQITSSRRAYLEMLSAFVGDKLNESTILTKPQITPQTPNRLEIRRPELTLFDAQTHSLNASVKEINADLMPRLGLFMTGGYGNPALNMLKDGFQAYYIGGVRLSWNFGAFYTRRNRLNLLESNRNTINVQRETFLFNTALNMSGKENEIGKFRDLLLTDDEIIALRASVKRSAEVRLENGTATTTDLLRETTAEQLARQDRAKHEIEMLQAIYGLIFLTNNNSVQDSPGIKKPIK
ncbi:MAG: TolC family protein [Tannerella sp.]|jgi:outer membrane protein TolC|nr:TolC family protein [Tannerella sp.]